VDAPEEHGAAQLGKSAAAIAGDAESRSKPRSPVDSPDLHPGDPLFQNPFPDETDPRHSILVPYFQIMDRFQILAEEYPSVSALWQADFGHWKLWPLPYRDAKVLSEHIGGSQEVPSSPGADLHLDYNATESTQTLADGNRIVHQTTAFIALNAVIAMVWRVLMVRSSGARQRS
jgi:hypothetical protein